MKVNDNMTSLISENTTDSKLVFCRAVGRVVACCEPPAASRMYCGCLCRDPFWGTPMPKQDSNLVWLLECSYQGLRVQCFMLIWN